LDNNEDIKARIFELLGITDEHCRNLHIIAKLKKIEDDDTWFIISKIVMNHQTLFQRFVMLAAFGASQVVNSWNGENPRLDIQNSREPLLQIIRTRIEQITRCKANMWHSLENHEQIWIASCILVRSVPTFSGRRANIYSKVSKMTIYSVTSYTPFKPNLLFFIFSQIVFTLSVKLHFHDSLTVYTPTSIKKKKRVN
jgi:hypothetical protein